MSQPKPEGVDEEALELLLDVQDGVVSRRQLVELGARDHEIARMLRRKELVRVHRGVFVNHTGPLTRAQREWAAVLALWPAALTRESALPKPKDDAPIQVAVDLCRALAPVKGVVAHRTTDFESRVDWIKSPPRVANEHAAIDVASSKGHDPLAMFRTLADVCQTRRTTAKRIAEVLRSRGRVPHKTLMLEMLDDLATGACSVLEREYLRIERLHGLPEGRRQSPAKASGRSAYRDVDYEKFGVLVELDGRPYHDDALSRDLDADRDLEALVESDRPTVRLTYGLVFGRPCRTIARIAALLRRRGWTGTARACPDCPDC